MVKHHNLAISPHVVDGGAKPSLCMNQKVSAPLRRGGVEVTLPRLPICKSGPSLTCVASMASMVNFPGLETREKLVSQWDACRDDTGHGLPVRPRINGETTVLVVF
jgi:hypothetical protein